MIKEVICLTNDWNDCPCGCCTNNRDDPKKGEIYQVINVINIPFDSDILYELKGFEAQLVYKFDN